MKVDITVGPDDQHGGGNAIAWYITVTDPDGCRYADSSGGWTCPASLHPVRTWAWVARLRRHVRLPREVRKAGLGWADATVYPFGWSEGAGHAPQGVVVAWHFRE